MGQIISKEKKQKREGLIAQMKDKTEVRFDCRIKSVGRFYMRINCNVTELSKIFHFQGSSSPTKTPTRSSPPPPPRGLSSTLTNTSLTQEFLLFLQQLDKDSGTSHDREDSLNFVIQIRNLNTEKDDKKKTVLLKQIGEKFFNPESGLVLDNTELWQRCASTCATDTCEARVQAEKNLLLAHDSVLPELDELHLLFLHQRREQTCVEKILCIL